VDYELVKVRTKKYDDGVLLTNDVGKWCFLTHREYEKYLFKDFDEELFNKLKESFMIITDDTVSGYPHQFNDYNWFMGAGTSLHIIVPTLRCNFTCKYCYAYRTSEERTETDMSPETMDKTIDFIFSTPLDKYNIEFTGGEPLLRFDLVKRAILRAEDLASKSGKKVIFSLVTNGTYINEEMIPFFKEHRVGICFSLDGPKEVHDGNRRLTKGNKPTYDIVIEKIELLRKHKYPSVNAIPVIVNNSLSYWKEIVDEYVKIGFTTMRFKYVSYFGFASQAWDNMSYEPEEFLDAWKKVIKYMIELNKKGVIISENIATMILFKFITGINANYAEMLSPLVEQLLGKLSIIMMVISIHVTKHELWKSLR
jgi:uncharacterized protein